MSIPPALERIRRGWDRAAAAGVPAHITILYPFLPPDELRPSVRAELAALAATVEPFDVRFASVGRFPTAVWLEPMPAAPFSSLTHRAAERFPGYEPYGGAFDEVIPHLTLVESASADLDEVARLVAPFLPFERRVGGLEVIVEDPDGRWRPRWRLPLGGPVRR